jgi:hypothetical protein
MSCAPIVLSRTSLIGAGEVMIRVSGGERTQGRRRVKGARAGGMARSGSARLNSVRQERPGRLTELEKSGNNPRSLCEGRSRCHPSAFHTSVDPLPCRAIPEPRNGALCLHKCRRGRDDEEPSLCHVGLAAAFSWDCLCA